MSASGDLIEEFRVDGALVPMSIRKNLTEEEVQAARTQRTFYYLNGLLRALSTLRVRHQRRTFGPLQIITDKNYLYSNAKIERISNWKKRGFVGAEGQSIQLATLWNYVYDWMTARFGFNKGILVVKKEEHSLDE
jgi:ribonuclease HI